MGRQALAVAVVLGLVGPARLRADEAEERAACEEDLSLESPDAPLAEAVASGAESFWIVGAISGG